MELGALLVITALTLVGKLFENDMNNVRTSDERAWQENMRDEANEYNKPINQVEREQEAGIYRNSLAMGQGSVLGGTSAPVSGSTLFPFADPISALANNGSLLANAYKASEEGITERSSRDQRLINVQRQNDLLLSQTQNMNLSNEAQQILNGYLGMREEAVLDNYRSSTELNYSQIGLLQEQTKEASYRLEKVLPEELQKIISERKLNVWNVDKILAEISSLETSSELQEKQTEFVESQIVGQELSNTGQALENQGKNIENQYASRFADKYLEELDKQIDLITEQTNLARKDVEYYLLRTIKGNIHSAVGGILPIASKGKGK